MWKNVYQPLIGAYLILAAAMVVAETIFVKLQGGRISEEMIMDITGLLLCVYILSFVVLIVLTTTIYRAIHRMTAAAERYARGEFGETIDIRRKDEIGRLADTMNYMAHELDTRQDDQRKFISNVSHDFRSPLTSIKGYAEAILDGTIPPEMQDRYLGIIISEAERLQGLTENLLDLNKYGARGFYLEISTFDINELIRRDLEVFESRCREKNIRIVQKLTPGAAVVKADFKRIQQVIHNLVDNALKFSDTDSEIIVETAVRSGKVFVSVKDFGVGIPKDSIRKIWDRFYKTDPSRGKDKTGTGLGLAIVREIIQAHKENINVISTEGAGSEFIFSLPYVG